MQVFGIAPILECSSKGDKRFSAFYARLKQYHGRSIEEVFQANKVFEDGSCGLSIKEAKGRRPVNFEECAKLYSELWDLYINENPELIKVILQYNGYSDIFGQENHVCQAREIYRIRLEVHLWSIYTSKDSSRALKVIYGGK